MFEQLSLFRLAPEARSPKPRHLLVGNVPVPYMLNQGRRRRLTLRIDDRGLAIGAPHGMPLAEIEAFARQHGAWVLQKLDELTGAPRARHLAVRDGSRLPLLGEDFAVRVLPGANRSRWLSRELVLEARPDADLALLARRALRRQALAHFRQRAALFAPRLGVHFPAVGLSSARTRWGSCSSETGIRIHWRLIHLPPHLGDYVVVHELAHLREMNHSPRFWALVAAACPGWQSARDELKAAAQCLPVI